MDTRTPEELAGGFIRVTAGGQERRLPTLKLSGERDWRLALAKKVGEAQLDLDFDALKEGGDRAYGALAPMANLPTDMALDLIVAYDRTAALGGREWLEENCDSAQLYDLLLRILRVVFPFVADLRGAIKEFMELLGAAGRGPLAKSSSTSGRSDTGDSDPTLLRAV